MREYSKKREYEKALSVKRRIEAITAVQQLHDRSYYPMYGELDELQNALNLSSLPITIECFDISNIAGEQAVGSMVRFVAGRPKKSAYKRFRIKSVFSIDDYSMIQEVIRRRYSRVLEGGKPLPDLIIIDGGKGHLSVAKKELGKLGVVKVPIVSIAKEYNHLYTVSRKQPIRLSPGSRLLLLIQRIRDEAHRFAINYHRELRRKSKFRTKLQDVKGVGPAIEKKLMDKFRTLDVIRKASVKDLMAVGISEKIAKKIVGTGL